MDLCSMCSNFILHVSGAIEFQKLTDPDSVTQIRRVRLWKR